MSPGFSTRKVLTAFIQKSSKNAVRSRVPCADLMELGCHGQPRCNDSWRRVTWILFPIRAKFLFNLTHLQAQDTERAHTHTLSDFGSDIIPCLVARQRRAKGDHQ
eukprot:3048228-Amphidinium_carterae.1